MIRPYITRYDRETVIKCITKNPHYEAEQIQRATHLNTLTINEVLRQLQDEGIISNVDDQEKNKL